MEDCSACAWDGYCIPDECMGIQKEPAPAPTGYRHKKKYSNNSISQKTSEHHGLYRFHTI